MTEQKEDGPVGSFERILARIDCQKSSAWLKNDGQIYGIMMKAIAEELDDVRKAIESAGGAKPQPVEKKPAESKQEATISPQSMVTEPEAKQIRELIAKHFQGNKLGKGALGADVLISLGMLSEQYRQLAAFVQTSVQRIAGVYQGTMDEAAAIDLEHARQILTALVQEQGNMAKAAENVLPKRPS